MFGAGSQIRKVFIRRRKISMLSAETGFTPIVMDLDKIDKKKMEDMKMDSKIVRELMLLHTEDDMARDIIRDFNRTGWRVIKRSKDGSDY